ncbi:MAG TPA: hypothetical protein VEF92_05740 [Burkholderiales bacterium]|nr:hypothetical protein [Burkholderiales bacterium]
MSISTERALDVDRRGAARPLSTTSTPAEQAFDVDRRAAARPSPGAERRGAGRPLSVKSIWIVALLLAAGAWIAGRLQLYTPGSDPGYYMGLVGSIMMALLLLYPLRKRLRILQRASELRHWFKLHMFLGIAGPVLVIYHSTMKIASLNAAVAFFSMLIVAGSGIIGRFIYTKIHHGLYGRQATLRERQEHLGLSGESVKSKFHFAPSVEQRLRSLEAYATDQTRLGFFGLRRFVTLAVRTRYVNWKSMREVRQILSRAAAERGWQREERARRIRVARQMLRAYLRELQEVAQFRTYERLFALWHVLHVPFVFMLVFSAIVHVVYVHMY